MATTRKPRPREADPRFQRSFKALIEAITQEVDRAPLGEISITGIVEVAGVTRPTFYQHFADIPDALRRAALLRLDAAFPFPAPIENIEMLDLQTLREQFTRQAEPIFEHLQEHKDFYLRVLEGATNVSFFGEIVDFVSARLAPEVFLAAARRTKSSEHDLNVAIASGVTWLVIQWLRGVTDRSPRKMALRCAGVALAFMTPADA